MAAAGRHYDVIIQWCIYVPYSCNMYVGLAAAGSDAIQVDSENTVVLLLTLWSGSEEGRHCSAEQLRVLAGHVRLLHTSSSYLLAVVPELR